MEVHDRALFNELRFSSTGTEIGALKHALEDLGIETQNAAMNAKIFSLDSKDDVAIVDPWIETIRLI